MSYAGTRPSFSGRPKRPSKATRSLLSSLAKRDANALRIEEALKLAEEIKSLMDGFVTDVESGWDDPANNVEGFKNSSLVVSSHHEECSVILLNYARALLAKHGKEPAL